MYLDFSDTDASAFNADICIIGAGAAGFSCALSLLNTGLRVLVLEGGLNVFNSKAADLHKGKIIGQPHTGIHDARERIVGGTTTKWGGQALPFMTEDFQKRDHIGLSGWPIPLDQLAPYYQKAEAILGTDAAVSFDNSPWKERKITEPDFSVDSINLFVTKWCKVPDFALQHGLTIKKSTNITLLRNANVVEILPTASLDAVEGLRIRSLDGKEGFVKAKYIIAAGGAIETVRLFLASRKFGRTGLGNEHGLVGCYFQDHVSATVGQVFPNHRKEFHNIFDPFYKRGFKYFPRIRLSPSSAKKSKTLHASAQIVFTEESDNVLGAAKRVLSDLKKKQIPESIALKSVINPLKIIGLFKAALRWKIKKRGSSPISSPVWLEIHSEQEPVKESRITLDTELDELGMPRICLNWSISDLTVKTIRLTAKLVRDEFHKTSIAKVKLDPWVEGNADPRCWLSDVYHQAGGLKMADSIECGVVDPSCRVFGIRNLYVASSAVFPTSSFSNPTMTTIALSIRIAENIAKQLN